MCGCTPTRFLPPAVHPGTPPLPYSKDCGYKDLFAYFDAADRTSPVNVAATKVGCYWTVGAGSMHNNMHTAQVQGGYHTGCPLDEAASCVGGCKSMWGQCCILESSGGQGNRGAVFPQPAHHVLRLRLLPLHSLPQTFKCYGLDGAQYGKEWDEIRGPCVVLRSAPPKTMDPRTGVWEQLEFEFRCGRQGGMCIRVRVYSARPWTRARACGSSWSSSAGGKGAKRITARRCLGSRTGKQAAVP